MTLAPTLPPKLRPLTADDIAARPDIFDAINLRRPLLGARGAGRTTAQLLSLPDGSLFIVRDKKIAKELAFFARSRGHFVFFSTAEDVVKAPDKVRGFRFPEIDVDHSLRDENQNPKGNFFLGVLKIKQMTVKP